MQDYDLPSEQIQALALLLAGKPVQQVAKAVGVNRSTVHSWLNTEAFRAAYRDARRAMLEQVVATMQLAAQEAADAVLAIMRDKKSPAATRLRAAQSIIEQGVEQDKLDRILERLEGDE